MPRLAVTAIALSLAAAPVPRAPPSSTRVVPALADPALVPGIARCTSDGACTVTDSTGTRPGTPLALTR